ncbi:unnamed protein product [Clonostachys chloroleuca]|uniref:Uncharacterized protein n=1 Tax=Clonostachys chloroleuca TaxID=1926264 RepID=A0AA35QF56_9HYPO|nr:unnamed protein product [Clonostachys chloroleuca]
MTPLCKQIVQSYDRSQKDGYSLRASRARVSARFVVSFGLYIIQACVVYFRLRQVKGPWLTGISGWPHSLAILSERCHEWYEEANQKYGPISGLISIPIPGIDDLLGSTRLAESGTARTMYSPAQMKKIHSRKRKQMVAGYSGRENLEMEISIDEQVQELVDLLRSRYLSTQEAIMPVDLAQKVHYFTLDVISSIGQGNTFGLLRTDFDVDDYLKSSHEGMKMFNAFLALSFSWLSHTPIIGAFISPARIDKRGIGRIMDMCFSQVDKRLAEPNDKRSDMLASFKRHGLEGQELRIESVEQFIAGSDTTSAGLRSALLHIITNPRVYRKLQKEANEAVRDGIVPKTSEGIITSNQAKRLPYLQAVVRETLRVWPPVAVLFSRDVPRGGDTVEVESGENVYLPGDISIRYSAHGMHRNEEIYGTDAKSFRPERWFRIDTAKLTVMLRTNDLIFGYGRFQCLGKVVAQMELGKLLFEIVRNFDIALIDPTKP